MPNRLAHASSPYLRQHAENPVDWQEWGDEAWEQARRENKPVFLSVGYSSCHWCHVMASESFEDPEVAAALNRDFVSIKLDREERPDVDDIYMTAVQLATGHGGWPMSVFLTPDQKPFFAGTYFPRHGRQGVPGFLQLVTGLAAGWRDDQEEILGTAEKFTEGLKQVLERSLHAVGDRLDVGLLDQAVQAWHGQWDQENGGFGSRPKFPPHAALQFLIRYAGVRHALAGADALKDELSNQAGSMALHTLDSMALGGIRDHVGGGFHRYATDENWFLPHFEKMLYDNAQLLSAYTQGAAATDDPGLREFFAEVTDQLVGWVTREMTTSEGLFMSALDADTHHEEGLSYTWRYEDWALVAGDPSLMEKYGIELDGNSYDEATGESTGRNIPFLRERVLRDPALDDLLAARLRWPQPGLDDKCLLGWNGLMIGALAEAGYIPEAERAARAWIALSDDLPHQVVKGKHSGSAFLEDYAYFIESLITLHEVTGNGEYLEVSERICDEMVDLFGDPRGGFTFTGRKHEVLIGVQKPCLDNATPSPNGVACRVLRRLGRHQEALIHLSSSLGWAQRFPTGAATLLSEALEHLLDARQASLSSDDAPQITLSLAPASLRFGEDGWAHTTLTLRIPNGYHINGTEASADWLVPTRLTVEGAFAEAAFTDEAQFTGELEVPLRLRQRGETDTFTVAIDYQLCSDSECLLPSRAIIAGSIDHA
ncbi:MAG: DUF255 domain-containing protein [Armatimonadetes bacterium]|nr:DUF255 domain-containing protein [Armatimonadota bacterium]